MNEEKMDVAQSEPSVLPDEDKPLQWYRCSDCNGTGRVKTNYHFIVRGKKPAWLSKSYNPAQQLNDATCRVCRGRGMMQR